MIYVTGDCHGDYRRFNTDNFPQQKNMTKDDYVIVCGDFGYWDLSKEQTYNRKWLSEKPFTTLFVDGNHENFDMLSVLPIEEWHGGKVHRIAPSIIHLMRGQVFNIDGMKFFTMGGAQSHDIQDGILDIDAPDFCYTYKTFQKQRKMFRVNHMSWWKDELPCTSEYDEAMDNLNKNNWNVDYVISHCCPSAYLDIISRGMWRHDKLTDFFDEVAQKLKFKQWFFGHYHDNKVGSGSYTMLYESIVPLDMFV